MPVSDSNTTIRVSDSSVCETLIVGLLFAIPLYALIHAISQHLSYENYQYDLGTIQHLELSPHLYDSSTKPVGSIPLEDGLFLVQSLQVNFRQ